MQNYLIVGLVCIVAALAFGVEPVQRLINETTSQGTLRGVETCMDYAKTELLTKDSIRATCVQSFQKRIYSPDVATGKAGPRVDQEMVGWGGVLQNKSPDYVTTWVEISVSVFDADGARKEVSANTSIWIEPMGEAEFRVDLPSLEREQFDNFKFCEHGEEEPKACMSWGVSDVMGLAM